MALDITVNGLEAGYGTVRVLHGISLRVAQGEVVALLGTNGNGKSTLMKCLMGLLRPTAGTVTLSDGGRETDITGLPPDRIVALGIVMVPEGRRLFPKLTVRENLMLGAYRRDARAEAARSLAMCYDAFPVLRERAGQQAGSMSGGQQQMLAIARALMARPRLMLVDEPSVGLAPALVRQTMDILGDLRRRLGLTLLMAEQNFHEASRIADRGYIMAHGEIAFEGRDLGELQRSEIVRQTYLGL